MVSAFKEFIDWKGRVSLGGHSEELAALGEEGESEKGVPGIGNSMCKGPVAWLEKVGVHGMGM